MNEERTEKVYQKDGPKVVIILGSSRRDQRKKLPSDECTTLAPNR